MFPIDILTAPEIEIFDSKINLLLKIDARVIIIGDWTWVFSNIGKVTDLQ